MSATGTVQRLADVPLPRLRQQLAGSGLWLDLGALTLRLRSNSDAMCQQLRQCYAAFPFEPTGAWADVSVQLRSERPWRGWPRRQAQLYLEGRAAFDRFPDDSPMPLFEWGCNSWIGQRANHLLLLHAGALERDGLALLMPALPGSGKSTLTAALAHRGWRLLSDEFGALDLQQRLFRAMLKPVALKNTSIDVIRRFEPRAVLGPSFPKTRKGTVAHVAAPADAVDRRRETAVPGAFLFPKWEAGSRTIIEPLPSHQVFSAVAFNSFNYGLLGAEAFDAGVDLARRCRGWRLVYSDLDDAVERLDALWRGQVLPAAR